MNNLVFNTTASELRTTLFAQAPGNEIKALQLDASDNLLVSVASGTMTVQGTVTVSEITAPVTIGNASLTVEGTITIGASTFTSDAVTSTSVSGTGVIFPDKDISTLKVASIFLYNEDTAPITISLQISPTTDDGLYMDDPSYTDQVIPGNESLYMAVSNFAHYIRLQYNLGGQTATFSAYYNAQA